MFFVFYLVRVQQAVVDAELDELSQQVQNLSLEGHRRAGGVLLQSLDHQGLKQTDVVVDGVLGKRAEHHCRGTGRLRAGRATCCAARVGLHFLEGSCIINHSYLVSSLPGHICDAGFQLIGHFLHHIKPPGSREIVGVVCDI